MFTNSVPALSTNHKLLIQKMFFDFWNGVANLACSIECSVRHTPSVCVVGKCFILAIGATHSICTTFHMPKMLHRHGVNAPNRCSARHCHMPPGRVTCTLCAADLRHPKTLLIRITMTVRNLAAATLLAAAASLTWAQDKVVYHFDNSAT